MRGTDRQPIPNTPSYDRISRRNPNRFGAVLSALHGFWISRHPEGGEARRDTYSVILFNRTPQVSLLWAPRMLLLMVSTSDVHLR